MANAITEGLYKTQNYFSVPQRFLDKMREGKVTGSEALLILAITGESNLHSSPSVSMTEKLGCALTGLSGKTYRKARRVLEKEGCIKSSRGRVILCDRDGNPFPSRREQLKLRDERRKQDSSFFEGPRVNGRDIYHLREDEYRSYYESRLQQECSGAEANVRCRFHSDHTPSLSVNLRSGVWFCHSCKVGGSVLAFEQKISSCDAASAAANISALAGAPDVQWMRQRTRRPRREPVVSYDYTDSDGTVLFTVHRYDSRPKFGVSRLLPNGRTVRNAGDRRTLYHLPEVTVAATVICTEGERDADNVRALGFLDADDIPVAVTCSPFGAGSWREEYAKHLEGKQVIIICDNDEPGMQYGDDIRDSLDGKANHNLVMFSKLPEGSDATDYLEQYGAARLVAEINQQVGSEVLHIPVTLQAAIPKPVFNICHTPVSI